MTELFVLFILAMPYLSFIGYAAWQIIKLPAEQQLDKVKQRFINKDEMELAKRYVAMFGLDSDELDVDIAVVLEMGRKYESYLGRDKIEEIHAAIAQAKMDRYFYQNPESRGVHHRINMVIKSSGLITAPSLVAVSTKITTGGNEDAEPSISLHAAA